MNYTDYENLPLFLTIEDVTNVLGIGKNTAYTLVRSGSLQSIRVGRQLRIPKESIKLLMPTK